MAGVMSNYLKNKLVDVVYRGGTYAGPTTIYVGLFTAAPTAAGGGTEVSGGSYARVAITASATNWASTGGAGTTTNPSAGTSGTTSNNAVITFPPATAPWGTLVYGGFFDAASAGNLLIAGPLNASQPIVAGNTYSIAAGALSYQIDSSF